MNFESEIRNGNFVLGECTKCKKTVWPPSDFCNRCFGKIIIKKGPVEGKIIEFSKHDKNYFCLAEFENEVKIIGKIPSGIPENNKKVKIEKCGMKNGSYFFEFSLN